MPRLIAVALAWAFFTLGLAPAVAGVVAPPALAQIDATSPYVFNNDPALLQHWRAGLAVVAARTGPATLNVFADSLSMGWGAGTASAAGVMATNARVHSIWHVVTQLMNASGVPARDDSWWGNANVDNYGLSEAALEAYDPMRSHTGSTWSLLASTTAYFGFALQTNSAGTDSLKFHPSLQSDSYASYCASFSGAGTYTVSTGGAALATQALTTAGATAIIKTTANATLGDNTWSIQRTTGGAVTCLGGEAWNSAVPDVHIRNFAVAGSQVSDWLQGSAGTTAYTGYHAPEYIPAQLNVFEVGANDQRLGVAPATYQTSLSSLIQHVKASGGDCMIVGVQPLNQGAGQWPHPEWVQPYRQARQAVAVAQGCVLIDLWPRFGGDWASGVYGVGYSYDSAHMLAAGQADVARVIERVLLSN